jgi:curli biogenesis system outer membrane secretion channel CsgG
MKRFTLSFSAIILLLSLSACMLPPQTTYFIKPATDFSKYKKIAVIRFEANDPTRGQEVSDTIAISFSNIGYSVVERSQLRAVIDENAFSQSGLTEGSRNALRLAGIEAVVVGSVTQYACTAEKGSLT